MIENEAVVTKQEADQIWIKSENRGGCGGCQQQTACGTSVLARLLPKREFAAPNELALRVGDKVTVAVDDSQLLFGSFMLYLLPLAVMLLAVITFDYMLPPAWSSPWLPIVAILALLMSLGMIHHLHAFLPLRWRPQLMIKAK